MSIRGRQRGLQSLPEAEMHEGSCSDQSWQKLILAQRWFLESLQVCGECGTLAFLTQLVVVVGSVLLPFAADSVNHNTPNLFQSSPPPAEAQTPL